MRKIRVWAAVAAIGILATTAGFAREADPLRAWATKRGWKAAPIHRTTLEVKGWQRLFNGGVWRNLPFDIAPEEEADVKALNTLASKVHASVNGRTLFADEDVRLKIEAILKDRPDFFYAEHLLGTWYRINNEPRKSKEHHERALEHAPVVLVQRYRDSDDRPLVGAKIQMFEIECNRVKKGSLDPSLRLCFPALETDGSGCIYLPCYDTVFRAVSMAHPPDYDVAYPRLGWFECKRKVGILPEATVTEKSEKAELTAILHFGFSILDFGLNNPCSCP